MGQGPRLGCAMGEVGGQQGGWSQNSWRSKKDPQLASTHLLQPRSSAMALLQIISNGKNPETKNSCWKSSRTSRFLPPSPYWARKVANQVATTQSSPSPLIMNTLFLHSHKTSSSAGKSQAEDKTNKKTLKKKSFQGCFSQVKKDLLIHSCSTHEPCCSCFAMTSKCCMWSSPASFPPPLFYPPPTPLLK